MSSKIAVALAVTLVLVAPCALAADALDAPSVEAPSKRSFHLDAEVDPTAYVLSGYSGHVGLGLDHFRLDLGAYAMAMPQFAHGNDGFDVRFDGFGAKLQLFPFAQANDPKGFFVGVDGGVTHVKATLQGTSLSDTQTTFGVGTHVGVRISLPFHFYVTPWIGVGYAWGGHDVTANGATFHASPITVFPAVHLGYRFL